MQDNTVTPADPPPELSAAVVRWNEFAKAVAHVLDSGPSECRNTLLEALKACYQDLNKVARHLPPYKEDATEVVTWVEEAKAALSHAILEGETALELAPAGLVESAPATVTEPEPVPATQPAPAAAPEPNRNTETDAARATGAETAPAVENEPAPAPDPAPTPLDQLMVRMDELCSGLIRTHSRYLGAWRPARTKIRAGAADPQEAAAVWTALHMALLRLPDQDRRSWRDRAAKAAQECLGAMPACEDLAVIVPALHGAEDRGGPDGIARKVAVPLDLGDAEALMQATADAPPDVLEAVGIVDVGDLDADDPRLFWAARAGQALLLTKLDPDLHAIIYPRTSRVPLTDARNQNVYRTTLLTNLTGAARAHRDEQTWDTRLGSARKLDGVLGGLLHGPTAAPGSWWWEWRRNVSLILDPLAREVGHEVVFDQVSEWRKTDLESYTEPDCNLAGAAGSNERLVQWVFLTPLRRIGVAGPQTAFPGRVIRRPDPAAAP
ncbi:hypothetical protein [Streptomyces sp. NPDC055287]